MINYRKIRIGRKTLETFVFKLAKKNLIVIRGKRGYVMCGYLNLKVAQAFKEAAVKIVGVSNIKEALATHVHSLTKEAKGLGIYKNQPIRDVLKIIA